MTNDILAALARIAAALERLSPPEMADCDIMANPAYRWDGVRLDVATTFRALPSHLIVGVDRQKAALAEMLARHGDGLPAHDVLLWGARGTGKSALVKSLVAELQNAAKPLALVECAAHAIHTLPTIFARLCQVPRRFVLFIDDIGFDTGAGEEVRAIRSMLDGGVEARPENIRLIVTSNRRNIMTRDAADREAINPRDIEEDTLALADRFSLKLGFQRVEQSGYLDMVARYGTHFGVPFSQADALQFAHQRGGPSGRTAWQYIVECAGRAGKTLDY